MLDEETRDVEHTCQAVLTHQAIYEAQWSNHELVPGLFDDGREDYIQTILRVNALPAPVRLRNAISVPVGVAAIVALSVAALRPPLPSLRDNEMRPAYLSSGSRTAGILFCAATPAKIDRLALDEEPFTGAHHNVGLHQFTRPRVITRGAILTCLRHDIGVKEASTESIKSHHSNHTYESATGTLYLRQRLQNLLP